MIKRTLSFIGCIIGGIITLYIIVNVFLLAIGYSRIYESTDIETYRNFGVPIDGGTPSIYSFPKNLEEVESVNEYFFKADFPMIGHTFWEIFLDVTYSEEKFYLEIERLSNFKRGNQELKFDKECILFNYPTYVAEYNEVQSYEYVIVDNLNFGIIYIRIDGEIGTKIYSEYLPKNYYQNLKVETSDGYVFSIYYGSDKWLE